MAYPSPHLIPGKRKTLAVAVSTVVASAYGAQSHGSNAIEEIVVTATKRAESEQNVPMAITAFSNADIVKEGFTKLDDYAGHIPALSYARREPGGTSVIMRGCATSGVSFSNNSTTSVYLDEQPITDAGFNPDPHLIDIKRIEALSGPQGTLFGDAAECGTLRIITNKPDAERTDGWVQVTGNSVTSGSQGYDLSGMGNIPLVENKLAIRFDAFDTREAGFIDNILAPSPGGTFTNAPYVGKNVNSSTVKGGRVALRWIPTDEWTIDAQGMFQDTTTNGFGDHSLNERFLANVGPIGPLQQVRYNHEDWKDKWYQLALTADGHLSFADVVVTGSFMNRRVRYDADSTAYLQAFQQLNPSTIQYDFGGDPHSLATDTRDNDRWSFEARMSTIKTADSRWSGIIGFFYNKVDTTELFNSHVQNLSKNCSSSIAYAAGCTPAFTYLSYLHYYYFGTFAKTSDNFFTGIYQDTIEQRAVYGEATFDLTENFQITVGGRWYDVNSYALRVNGPLANLQNDPVLICGTQAEQNNWQQNGVPVSRYVDVCFNNSKGWAKEHGFVPKFNATWHYAPDKLVYFTYSEGFRRGGVNDARRGLFATGGAYHTYKSDKLKNFEIGTKTRWMDGRLELNLTAYHMLWEHIQLQGNDPTISGYTQGIINLPEATMDGVEGMFAWVPTENWNLSANFGYNDARLSQSVNSFGQHLADGTRLPLSPKWKASVSVEYYFSNDIAGMQPFILGTYEYHGDSTNSLKGIGGTEFNNPPRIQHAYSLLNLRAGLNGSSWSATFFIDNVTNKHAELFFNDRWVQVRQSVNRPRTFGLTVRKRFKQQ